MSKLIFILFLFVNSLQNDKISKYVNDKGYYCKGKLYDPLQIVPETELYEICYILKNDKNFMISIKKSLNLIGMTERSREMHAKDTEKMFEHNCPNFAGFCENGIIISIYTLDREIIIHAGEKIKNKISSVNINLVKLNIINSAMLSKYLDAIKTAIIMLRNLMNKSNDQTRKKNVTEETFEFSEVSRIIIKILFMVVVIALVILLAIYLIPDSTITNKPSFYNYTGFLINILEEIKNSPERKITVGECLICLNSMKNEMEENKGLSKFDELIVFNCRHIYHKMCQEELIDLKCVICSENIQIDNSFKIEKFSSEITECQIFNLVGKIPILFSEKEINEYYEIFGENSKIFDKVFNINKDILLKKQYMTVMESEDIKAKKIK